ncbi:hypothetical protein PVMG_05511 [Plasmodium vivax Mauritania I]|uniref:Variable surface protein Vir35 n=1 Tax=Plasmodium vivax Mauritania I TaxID=1035515 RepID=A0A0J9TH22_PLAVI|nr:hypothetical protein PVMG_05511 [Plasmodium vivax Mauritania I]
MIYGQDGSLNISFNRLLAKHELKKDSYKTYARQKYANYGMNNNIKSEEVNKRSQSQIRKDCLNNYDAYMKGYKNRYSKKKGLAKLDCYYEKKVLKRINNIFEISENMRNKKNPYNKKIYNKYIMSLVLFSIIPFFGLIIIFYFSKLNPYMQKACFSECLLKHKGDGSKSANFEKAVEDHKAEGIRLLSIDEKTFHIIEMVNDVFLWLSFSIVLLVLLYILLKIIKYARIKSGKGKMSVKDYCHFCKDLFIAK